MTTPRLRRRGITLLEVLIAIFTMGIGLLALLTLFPLGAIQMAQAIKDDRTGNEATHADALLRSHWNSVYLGGGPMAYKTPLVVLETNRGDAFDDPQSDFLVGNTQRVYPDSPAALHYRTRFSPVVATEPPAFPPGSPSFPVMLDGLGYFARINSNPEKSWVGRNTVAPNTGTPSLFLMPRRSALGFSTLPTPAGALIEPFSLTDDLTFETNGAATGPALERQGRYNWSAIVQLPRHETRGVAKLTIMVFDGRPALLANPGDEMVVSVPNFTVGVRTVTLTVPPRNDGSAPLIRRGGWIMDSSIKLIPIAQPMTDPVTDQMWIRHANFYRIAGLTEVASGPAGTTFTLDLESPIKPLWNGRATFTNGTVLSYTANITLFAGLSEVFERHELRPETPNN